MKKVLLVLGFLLVVAVALVGGAVIHATWFDSRQEVEAPIVPYIPSMTKEEVKALVITHNLRDPSPAMGQCSYDIYTMNKDSGEDSVRYMGAGTWIFKFGRCAATVDDRTGKVSP